jgi:hypothetical protein
MQVSFHKWAMNAFFHDQWPTVAKPGAMVKRLDVLNRIVSGDAPL